ncbi:MAG: ABC transporter ATP-binding protein [Deltaproteobacteria bacterium]|nr:ABC transporter ATP-binding protein [Deltaproteobacteria bacterium]
MVGLSKSFATGKDVVSAVSDVTFEVQPGEFYTLLGPSGCGKTTTLRCIAGLETPDAGKIAIGERTVSGDGIFVPAYEREIGMVFQSYAVWPHLTVFDNVALPLKHGRVGNLRRAEINDRVLESLRLVKMDSLAARYVPYLSGGQQQRVALARALVVRPKVLLLDEPLSNLDAKLRDEMRLEIKELVKGLGITGLYVTHDQVEALSMSDRVAVMFEGHIVQEGVPREVYEEPNSLFVAQFVGFANFLEGEVLDPPADGIACVATPYGNLSCHSNEVYGKGDHVVVVIRPEKLRIGREETDPLMNTLKGVIRRIVFRGASLECLVEVGSKALQAVFESGSAVREGDQIELSFAAQSCAIFRH